LTQPVLVTGAIRTGTTWVGETLARSPDLEYIWEPYNPLVRAWPHSLVPHFMTGPYDAQPLVDDIATSLVGLHSRGGLIGHPESFGREVQRRYRFAAARRAKRAALIKDPLAVLLARHLQERFGFRVVLCVRHPAGFVASCMRLGWDYDFENLLAQPQLMQRLSPWREEMEATVGRTGPMLHRVTLLWRVIYGALADGDLAPATPYVVRYEEAVADSAGAFHQLATELDLQIPGGPPVDTTRADAWRMQLTRAEIADIRTSSEPEATRWDYSGAAAW
jgi:hypothetical protein